MVLPFTKRQVLGASVGIKEDTSNRKFKDIKLAEFFGIKGGRSATAMTERVMQDHVVEGPTENLLKLSRTGISSNWLLPRGSPTAPVAEESFKTTTTATDRMEDMHSTQNNDILLKLSGYEFYFLISCFFVALLSAKKIEKAYLNPTTS